MLSLLWLIVWLLTEPVIWFYKSVMQCMLLIRLFLYSWQYFQGQKSWAYLILLLG